MPQNFTSKVTFFEDRLAIRFRYCSTSLEKMATHHSLWYLFSSTNERGEDYLNTIFLKALGRFKLFGHTIKEFDEETYRTSCELLNQARYFFQKIYTPKPVPMYPCTISSIDEMLSEVYKSKKGFSLGEVHEDPSSKLFLLKYMAHLVTNKVKVIFTESYFASQQDDLDAYFREDTTVEDVPEILMCSDPTHSQKSQSGEKKFLYRELLKRAKICGIQRIVAIDSEAAMGWCSGLPYNVADRPMRMNFFALEVIQKNMPTDGNYLIHAGAAHIAPSPVNKNRYNGVLEPLPPIPSLSHLLVTNQSRFLMKPKQR